MVTKPTSTASGDLLVLCVVVNDQVAQITLPSGFQEFASLNQTSGIGSSSVPRQTCLGWKIAGGSEPADYTVTLSTPEKAAITLSRFTNSDSVCPIGQIRTERVASGNHRGPALTADAAVLAMRVVANTDDYTTMVADSGLTEILNTETTTSPSASAMVGVDTVAYEDTGAVAAKGWVGDSDTSQRWTFLIYGDGESGMEAAEPVVESQTDVNESGSVSYAIDKPSGTVQNDLLLFIACDPAATDAMSLDGFTTISTGALGSSDQYYAAYKVAGASEPATYTLTPGSILSNGPVGVLLRISGINTSAPINASSFDTAWDDANTSEVEFPSVSTTANCLIVRGVFSGSGQGSFTERTYILPNSGTILFDDYTSAEDDAQTLCFHEAVCVNGGTHPVRYGWRNVSARHLPFTIAVAAAP